MNDNRVIELLTELPFFGHLGLAVAHCSEGRVEVEMPFRAEMSSDYTAFPAAIVGAIGDVAAVASSLSCLPEGWFTATLDFTVKTTKPAIGQKLLAKGRALQVGTTISVAQADIFTVTDGEETQCATLLASSRNFRIAGA